MVGKIRAKVVKSKLSMSAGHEALFYIRWGEGIDDVRSLLELAISYNIFKKSGAWIVWTLADGTEVRGQGKDLMRAKLKEDPALVEALYAAVVPFLTTDTPDEELYNEDTEVEDDFSDAAVDGALDELEKMVNAADAERAAKLAVVDGFEPEEVE